MLKAGDKAPTISLLDQNNKQVTLKDFAKRKVLVYFYPRADTPGCTLQSCLLRDIRKQIGKTAIIGISPDDPAKQLKFDKKYELGFTLLADTEHIVAKAFEVWKKKFETNQMSESDYSWLSSAADELGMRDFSQQVRESKPRLTSESLYNFDNLTETYNEEGLVKQ